jgi:hypothetical protein
MQHGVLAAVAVVACTFSYQQCCLLVFLQMHMRKFMWFISALGPLAGS